ncbi:MAG: CARDB domain-containing protein [Thermoplasmata archaeon]
MSGRYANVLLGAFALLVLAVAVMAAGATAESSEGAAAPRAASYTLSITAENSTRWVNTSTLAKMAQYGFQVKNTGDTSLPMCNLTLYPWNFATWSYTFIPSVPMEVNPGETKSVLLTIYPDMYAEAKRYTFQIKGTKDIPTNTISINLDVRPWADVAVRAPPPKSAYPGETLEFTFEIYNAGNVKEKFYVASIETGVARMVPYLKDGSNLTYDVAIGKSTTKTVVVMLPYDLQTTEGTAGLQLSMTVYCISNASQEDTNWTYIQVYHIYDIAMGVSPLNATLNPGEQAEFTITVLNLGNGNDRVTLDLTPNFDHSAWTISTGADYFNLPPGRTNSTKLKITPPLNALKGSNYKIEVRARSSGPPFPAMPIERSETITIAVRQIKQIHAPVVNFRTSEPIGPGEVVRFGFNFTNLGNGEDFVNITTLSKPLNWHVGLDFYLNIRVQPYATQQVSLTVQSSVNRNESLFQTYTVLLQLSNSDRSSVINLTFLIDVKPVYDWTFEVDGPSTGQVNPFARNTTSFTLLVRNLGNVAEDIQLTLEGENARLGRLDTSAISLAYGETKVVRLQVEVPTTAEVSRTYSLDIAAASQNQPELVKRLTVSVVVVHLDVTLVPPGSLEINGQVWKEYKTELYTRLNISATMRNDGTDAVKNVNVRFYDNDILIAERNSTTVAPSKSAKFNIVWIASSLGTHVIRVRIDANNQLGEVDEGNNEGVATIEVRTEAGSTGGGGSDVGWVYIASVLTALLVAGAVAYVIIRRRPKVDKELYESIYGKKGEQETIDPQLAAERAEVERRALEKMSEEAIFYEGAAAEAPPESAPPEEGSVGSPKFGEALSETGAVAPEPAESGPAAPPTEETGAPPAAAPVSPQEPVGEKSTVVLPPPKKRKITIRPVTDEK